jgi:hypothetical protein
MKEYKVLPILSLPDDIIKPKEMEERINASAKEGWKVVSCTESISSFKGKEIDRIFIILEKDE